MRTIQAFALMLGALCISMTLTTAYVLWRNTPVSAQFPAPSSEPPIQWNPATDTLTITRKDVMVCIPQDGQPQPSCRFAKWWTETVIR